MAASKEQERNDTAGRLSASSSIILGKFRDAFARELLSKVA